MDTGPDTEIDDNETDPPVHTPPGMIRRVPNQPKTPIRSIRIPEELWDELKQAAAEDGTDVSTIMRAQAERYLKRRKRAKEQQG
jgi:hypothetical protein